MAKTKKSDNLEYCRGIRVMDVAVYVFALLAFGVYPLIYDDHYFNITITKYHFFLYAAGIYLALALIGYVVEANLKNYYKYDSLLVEDTGKKRFLRPEFYALAFLMANFFAWLCADNKKDAFYGLQGRRMGLCLYLVLMIVFVVLAQRVRPQMIMFIFFAAANAFAYAVAIGQHMEHDFLNLRYNIASNQYTKFISTFGNINMYASYLSISIPVLLAVFAFCKNWFSRILSGVLLIAAGCNILIANSDSVFLGIFAGVVVVTILAFMQGRLRYSSFAVFLLFVGNLVLGFINKYGHTRYDKKRGGLAIALNRLDIAFVLCGAALLVFAVVCVCNWKLGTRVAAWNKKKIVLIVCGACVALGVIGIIVLAVTGSSLLTFNDKWGSYRGYIWRKIVEVYGDAPFVNKLFGYGNESVRVTLKAACYNEMVQVTGKVYDNAHNELLQYLFTTGIVGLLSYLALVGSSIVYMFMHAKEHAWISVCLAATVGYFAQSILNLNQPITTPLFFVFMAMGVGTVNYCRRVKELEKRA
jgi:O-antigen ligase